MGLLSTSEISLMAFASEDVIETWRDNVISLERASTQRLDVTVYSESYGYSYHVNTGHTDRYDEGSGHTDRAHVDSHSNADSHRNTPHTDSYDRKGNVYTNVPARDSYYQANRYSESAHTNRYTESNRHTNTTRRTAAYRRSHINRGGIDRGRNNRYADFHTDVYSQSHTDRYAESDTHSNRAARNSYTEGDRYNRAAHRDSYGNGTGYSKRAHGDAYTQKDSYSQNAHRDSYSRGTGYRERYGYDKSVDVQGYQDGFNHENYIPSAPELYDIDGRVIAGSLDVILASYDKNKDGEGSQDANSKDIYYTVKIRRVQTLTGEPVSESWKTLQAGSRTDEFNVNIGDYPDGIYEISTQAYNLPRTENNVTKTYVSDQNIFTFTIDSGILAADLTILNAVEFYDYAYGKETFRTRTDEIKRYVDSVIYANGSSSQQKGLFLEILLEDEDEDSYHKVKAGLAKGSTVIASGYDVIFPTGSNGKQLPGTKTGVVFIPLSDMLDDGSFADVNITLDVTEYEDSGFTVKRGRTTRTQGVSSARDVVYIDLDNMNPEIHMTDPAATKVQSQNVNITLTDVGLGIHDGYYQIVRNGEAPVDDGWIQITGNATNIEMNVAGSYDIYVKTRDRAGNEKSLVKTGYVISSVIVRLEAPTVIEKGDTLDVTGKVFTDMEITDTKFWIQDQTGKKTGILESDIAIGELKESVYTQEFDIPDSIPNGIHIIVFEVTLEDGSKKTVTKPIFIVDEIVVNIIECGVGHTDQWNENRFFHNENVSAAEQRGPNIFWAGEKFIVGGKFGFDCEEMVSPGGLITKVKITNKTKPDGSYYEMNFDSYFESMGYLDDLVVNADGTCVVSQYGGLWDESMLSLWDGVGPTPIEFEFTFGDDSTQTYTVYVDNTVDYYRLHSTH